MSLTIDGKIRAIMAILSTYISSDTVRYIYHHIVISSYIFPNTLSEKSKPDKSD